MSGVFFVVVSLFVWGGFVLFFGEVFLLLFLLFLVVVVFFKQAFF